MQCTAHSPWRLLLLCVTALCLASSLAATAAAAAATASASATAHAMTSLVLETEVQRGIMYDRRLGATQGRSYGTRAAVLRGDMSLYTATADDATATTAAADDAAVHRHRTVYVPCEAHLTQRALAQLTRAPVRGLLVEVCDEDAHNEQLLAAHYATSASSFAVYFIARGDDTHALLRALQQTRDAHTDRLVVAVGTRTHSSSNSSSNNSNNKTKVQQAASPVASASVDAYTLVSQLVYRPREQRKSTATAATTTRASMPRVLLTANVDTMGVAPALRSPAGASGAVAAMELWRRLTTTAATAATMTTSAGGGNDSGEVDNGNTSSTATTRATPYSATMLLATTARLNYIATATWLSSQKSAEVERLRMVVCLDELLPVPARSPYSSDSDKDAAAEAAQRRDREVLYMHVSDTLTRSAEGKLLQQLAHTLAAAHGVVLQMVPAKANYHHYDLRFEHEVFANKQIPAATFSTYRTQLADQPFRGVRYVATAHDVDVLLRRVNFVYAFVQALLEPNMTAAAAASDKSSNSSSNDGASAQSWPGARTYLMGLLQHSNAHTRSAFAHDGAALRAYMEEVEQHMRQQGSVTRGSAATALSTLHAERLALSGIRLYAPYEEVLRVYVAKTTLVELALSACTAAAVLAFAWSEFGYAGVKRVLLARD